MTTIVPASAMLRHMHAAMRVVLTAAVVLCSHACGDTEITKLEAIRATVCACKTAACGQAAMQQLPAVIGTKKTASTYRSQEVARAMVSCLAKLYEEAKPETGPDVDTDVPDPAAL